MKPRTMKTAQRFTFRDAQCKSNNDANDLEACMYMYILSNGITFSLIENFKVYETVTH